MTQTDRLYSYTYNNCAAVIAYIASTDAHGQQFALRFFNRDSTTTHAKNREINTSHWWNRNAGLYVPLVKRTANTRIACL